MNSKTSHLPSTHSMGNTETPSSLTNQEQGNNEELDDEHHDEHHHHEEHKINEKVSSY